MNDQAPTGDDADALTGLRDELERVGELPIADRVERFEHVNEGIAAELARLDDI